jgi:threonyl-tRNA synthetase
VGHHTDVVSRKELKPQKEKKPKAAPVSQFPLEVRRHSTVTSLMHDSYVSHQLQPPPDFFDHRVKIFEELRAEYDAFVQGLPLCSSTLK